MDSKRMMPTFLMFAALVMPAGQGALAQTGQEVIQRIESMERDLRTLKGQLEDAC